jgi:hypothetical protein
MFLHFEESQAGICLRMHAFSTKSYSCDGFGTKMDALLLLYVCHDLLIIYQQYGLLLWICIKAANLFGFLYIDLPLHHGCRG